MGFIILLILSTLSIAGSAAFFSIYGLARVFSGSFWPIVIMASSLEGGKLVAASFLYRYWNKMARSMRGYLIGAVASLMLITSMGIFGYLSSAYQDNVLPFEQHNQQITLLESEKTEAEKLKTERLARQDEINKQIANLPNNFVNGRKRLIDANKDELAQITKDVAQYTKDIREHTTQISTLKNQTLQETAHVGPIIFMARAFGLQINQATTWLIGLIIFVFDPLAVILTVGTNMALRERKKEKEEAEMNSQGIATSIFPSGFATKIELADPPVYSEDKQFQLSKDGMLWTRVAPHAAAGGPPLNTTQHFTVSNVAGAFGGAAPAPGPFTTVKIGGELPVTAPEPVKTVFDIFTKQNLTSQEKRMKEELETLLKRHQEVLDAAELRSKS